MLILYLLPVASCFLFAFFQSCSVGEYKRDEAERSLKVLNSDMTNFMAATNDRKELKAIEFLWNEPSVTFPFNSKFSNCDISNDSIRNLVFGSYEWDRKSKKFVKVKSSIFLEYKFPTKGSSTNNAELIINALKSDKIASNKVFPTEVKAEFYIDKQLYLTFDFKSTISDSMLSSVNAVFTGIDYRAEATFSRTKVVKTGTADLNYRFDAAGTTLLHGSISASLKYLSKGYNVEKVKMKHRLFHHTIEAEIDYDKVDKSSSNLGFELNKYTKAAIFEMPRKKKLGDIQIESNGKGNKLKYVIRFENNEQVLLSNYLLLLKKFQELEY